MAEDTMAPVWTISADKTRIRVWLGGGCIDSIERLDEAETFLRLMRPLLQSRTETAQKQPQPSETNVNETATDGA